MIIEVLNEDIYKAQKEKDADKLLVLRYLLSQVKNEEIELKAKGEVLSDEDVLRIMKRQIKKRKKAIEQYKQGNRPDIVKKEEQELDFMESYYTKFSQE